MHTESSPTQALFALLCHSVFGALGSVHSQTPRVLTRNRIQETFSKRCIKDLVKALHPFGPKTLFWKRNPTFDHSLDEGLVCKFWEFPGQVHFSSTKCLFTPLWTCQQLVCWAYMVRWQVLSAEVASSPCGRGGDYQVTAGSSWGESISYLNGPKHCCWRRRRMNVSHSTMPRVLTCLLIAAVGVGLCFLTREGTEWIQRKP